jgi:hypothetical protein
MAKLAAAFIAALAVVAFLFCVRQLTDLSTSTFVATAFAFGTSVWATASQGLWQHTPSILFQSLAFWFLLRGLRLGARAVEPAGLFLSAATVARPPNLVTTLIFMLFVLICFRQSLLRLILWALPLSSSYYLQFCDQRLALGLWIPGRSCRHLWFSALGSRSRAVFQLRARLVRLFSILVPRSNRGLDRVDPRA